MPHTASVRFAALFVPSDWLERVASTARAHGGVYLKLANLLERSDRIGIARHAARRLRNP